MAFHQFEHRGIALSDNDFHLCDNCNLVARRQSEMCEHAHTSNSRKISFSCVSAACSTFETFHHPVSVLLHVREHHPLLAEPFDKNGWVLVVTQIEEIELESRKTEVEQNLNQWFTSRKGKTTQAPSRLIIYYSNIYREEGHRDIYLIQWSALQPNYWSRWNVVRSSVTAQLNSLKGISEN